MPSVVPITGTSAGIGRLAAETVAGAGHIVYATRYDNRVSRSVTRNWECPEVR